MITKTETGIEIRKSNAIIIIQINTFTIMAVCQTVSALAPGVWTSTKRAPGKLRTEKRSEKFRTAEFGQRTDCMGKPHVEAMELTITTRRAVRIAVMAAPQSMLFPFQA
jgi:hypothetical protein